MVKEITDESLGDMKKKVNVLKRIEVTEEDFRDPILFQVGYLNQIPHKKQMEVLKSGFKNKIIVCGRRSGKTQMISGEIIRGAVLGEYKRQIVIAPIFKQTLIVYNKIIELMYRGGVYDDIKKVVRSPYPQIVFKNDSFVDFGSADNPASLRGEAYDRVFLDESAFIKEGAMDAIKPLTFDTGAPIWETTTPWGKGSVWERWSRGKKGDEAYGCFHYNYLDNPYLDPEGIKEIEKDIEEYGEDSVYVQCEILGNFVEDRDKYFKQKLIDSCVDNYKLGEWHPKSIFLLGVDVAGMGEDESIFIVVEQDMKGNIRVNFIDYYEKNKPREVVGMVKILDDKYHFEKVYLDETGIGEGPTDWLKETLSEDRVEGMKFTIASKQDIYSNLKKLMQQGRLKIPPNRKLLFQLADLRREVAGSGDIKIHHSEKGHDDYPDALALAVWYFKDVEMEEYEPWIM